MKTCTRGATTEGAARMRIWAGGVGGSGAICGAAHNSPLGKKKNLPDDSP